MVQATSFSKELHLAYLSLQVLLYRGQTEKLEYEIVDDACPQELQDSPWNIKQDILRKEGMMTPPTSTQNCLQKSLHDLIPESTRLMIDNYMLLSKSKQIPSGNLKARPYQIAARFSEVSLSLL